MNLKTIKTEKDYQLAIKEVERLFNVQDNAKELDKLDVLTTLIEAYEKENYPIEPPSAIAAILYYLETRNPGVSVFIKNLKCQGVSEEIINTALNAMTQ